MGCRENEDHSPIPIPPNLVSCDGNSKKRGSDLQQSRRTLELYHTAQIVGFGKYDLGAKLRRQRAEAKRTERYNMGGDDGSCEKETKERPFLSNGERLIGEVENNLIFIRFPGSKPISDPKIAVLRVASGSPWLTRPPNPAEPRLADARRWAALAAHGLDRLATASRHLAGTSGSG
ncbi:hypothetical protein C8R44DRAFT_741981 [Mycena epipterygia]|nr:hypothetical protein C8R44DRAFT_741981 [Mycena epipterygia]